MIQVDSKTIIEKLKNSFKNTELFNKNSDNPQDYENLINSAFSLIEQIYQRFESDICQDYIDMATEIQFEMISMIRKIEESNTCDNKKLNTLKAKLEDAQTVILAMVEHKLPNLCPQSKEKMNDISNDKSF